MLEHVISADAWTNKQTDVGNVNDQLGTCECCQCIMVHQDGSTRSSSCRNATEIYDMHYCIIGLSRSKHERM